MFRLQCGESRFEVRRVHFDCWQTNTEGCVLCRRWVAHLDIVQEASSLTGTTNHSPGIAKIADSWRNQSMRFAGRLWSSINSEDPGGPLSVEKQVGDIWRCLFQWLGPTWTKSIAAVCTGRFGLLQERMHNCTEAAESWAASCFVLPRTLNNWFLHDLIALTCWWRTIFRVDKRVAWRGSSQDMRTY
jgi:hypothetical protein